MPLDDRTRESDVCRGHRRQRVSAAFNLAEQALLAASPTRAARR
jgi:hypothetical protein